MSQCLFDCKYVNSSLSIATIFLAPLFFARIDKIPEPVPISKTDFSFVFQNETYEKTRGNWPLTMLPCANKQITSEIQTKSIIY